MSKTFLLVAALASGGFAVVGPVTADAVPTLGDDILPSFDSHEQVDDIDPDQGFLAIEVSETSTLSIPEEDHGDVVTLVQLISGTEPVPGLDAAGRQRTAAGRVVDAPPGSLDAAYTGMQHDAGGTVRNTVSPEPTPSPIVEEQRAADPDLAERPTPKVAQATENEEGDGA